MIMDKKKKEKLNKKYKLYKYLKNFHTGKHNAIVCKQLELVMRMDEKDIRWLVRSLRKEGFPICSCCYGYYYPDSYTEIVETATRFNKYVGTLMTTSSYLLNASLR